jgi:hypothetical protein
MTTYGGSPLSNTIMVLVGVGLVALVIWLIFFKEEESVTTTSEATATDTNTATATDTATGAGVGAAVAATGAAVAGAGAAAVVATAAAGAAVVAAVVDKYDGKTFYINSSDNKGYIHTGGGSVIGKTQSLHECPKGSNHPNCQWTFEKSTTRDNAYYINSSDNKGYIHTTGVGKIGNLQALHACPKDKDYAHCQWKIEESEANPGSIYINSSDDNGYMHTRYGSKIGHQQTLSACSKDSNYPECQWNLEAV